MFRLVRDKDSGVININMVSMGDFYEAVKYYCFGSGNKQ